MSDLLHVDKINTRLQLNRLNDLGESLRIAMFNIFTHAEECQVMNSTRYTAMRYAVLDASAHRCRLLGPIQQADPKLLRYELKEEKLSLAGIWEKKTETYSVADVF